MKDNQSVLRELVTAVAPQTAPARYYTLTGIAVDTPSRPGIYIAVNGSRASKMVVKQ